MRTTILTLLTGLLLLSPATLRAQDTDETDHPRDRGRGHHEPERCSCGLREVRADEGGTRRKGFWAAVGLGVGGESFDANDGLGWSDDKAGGIAYLKLGGTVSRSLLLGAEAQLWASDYVGQGYQRSLGSLMGVAQWYPAPAAGFWLRGGLGWARDDLRYGNGPVTQRRNGTALALGMGYDIPVARSVSVTPTLDLLGHHYQDHDERVVSLGLGVTFH